MEHARAGRGANPGPHAGFPLGVPGGSANTTEEVTHMEIIEQVADEFAAETLNEFLHEL